MVYLVVQNLVNWFIIEFNKRSANKIKGSAA